jgi:hypothetical protein
MQGGEGTMRGWWRRFSKWYDHPVSFHACMNVAIMAPPLEGVISFDFALVQLAVHGVVS